MPSHVPPFVHAAAGPFTHAAPADDQKADVLGSTPLPRPAQLVLALALLLAALATLLCRPVPSSAAVGACAAAQAKQHVRACAGRSRAGRAHGRARRKHTGRHHRINKKRKAAQHGSVDSSGATVQPATCEDGSRPAGEADGSFSCADGSEPVCAGGGEPVPAQNAARLVCPATASGETEWSEAECEDGDTPERSPGGAYACEDGSQPACADGSRPTPSDEGSMLVCLAQGTPAPSAPVPSSPGEDGGEDEAEG